MKERRYVGIDKDPKGAMNPTGNIIRDAWVFEIIPESMVVYIESYLCGKKAITAI